MKVKAVMPPFEDIPVSTKTVIAHTNATYDIGRLYDKIPVVSYNPPIKRRGRRTNPPPPDEKDQLPSGAIVTLKYFQHHRGVDLKGRNKKGNGKFFRNALSVVMKVTNPDGNGKLVNFKLSKNGKFQLTGIKTNEHAIMCVKYLWKYILDLDDHTLFKIDGDNLEVIMKIVMTNIDFSLGFKVNREKLDRHFNSSTDYHSLLETSFGYTGVNIKFPNELNLDQLLTRYSLDIKNEVWNQDMVTMRNYLERLTPAEYQKETNKRRYNTFLVFHSGNVIMSGSFASAMVAAYYEFLDIVKQNKDEIEEHLLVDEPPANTPVPVM